MRVLVITNLFPPVALGGYEEGCCDVVAELHRRGHDVTVLTSDWRKAHAPQEVVQAPVLRMLPHFFDRPEATVGVLARAVLERRAAAVLTSALRELRPDVVYVFNLRFVPKSLLLQPCRHAVPVAVYVSDPWFERWRHLDSWLRWHTPRPTASLTLLGQRAVRRLSPLLGAASAVGALPGPPPDALQFTSAALLSGAADAGEAVDGARVIPWGIDPSVVVPRDESRLRGGLVLFVGRIEREKGLHTLVEAMSRLPSATSLRVVGASQDPEYEQEVRRLASRLLQGRVEFVGRLPRQLVRRAYAEADCLVLPSEWDEPFSIILVEAMAAGLPVVATARGGSPEIVRHGANGLLYPSGDVPALEERLRMALSPFEGERLGCAAAATVASRYTLHAMVDEVEDHLQTLVSAGSGAARRPETRSPRSPRVAACRWFRG